MKEDDKYVSSFCTLLESYNTLTTSISCMKNSLDMNTVCSELLTDDIQKRACFLEEFGGGQNHRFVDKRLIKEMQKLFTIILEKQIQR